MFSHIQFFATQWTVAHQVPLSMGFPRQEYWSRLPFPAPGNLPDPGIKPTSPAFSVLTSRFSTTAPPGTLPLNISQGFQFSIINMRFSRQEYWTGVPFPPPGNLPDPGIKPGSLLSPALVGGILTTSATWEAHKCTNATRPPGVFLK